jgi:hypothetical protein
VVGPTGVALHTASGASPTVSTLLGQAAQQLGGGATITVVDVVPGAPEDPRGAGFFSGHLPRVLAGVIAGVLFAVVLSRWSARLVGLGTFAVLARGHGSAREPAHGPRGEPSIHGRAAVRGMPLIHVIMILGS